ncbi:MAG: type II toxin-antitoxin system HicA family toxin [Methylococcaceae bacterium]|nr:type II toxin-antitoxin system HicA family toxin [Methylococcaceae bacterium]
MPKDKRKVEEALLKKGFEDKEGDHHFFIYHTLQGKKSSIRTKTSHTPKMKEISDGILAQMAKQCRLNKQDFMNLIDCPLSREQYEARLIEKGGI